VPQPAKQFRTADVCATLLLAERRRRGTPRGSRALTCFWQAVLGLRWFRDRTAAEALARDHGISRATAYRYLDEVIIVLADQGGRELDVNARTRNAIQRSLRCLGERGFALLTGRWRTLQHITASPGKIGTIARATFVLSHSGHGYIT
jgi:hypothetical protein